MRDLRDNISQDEHAVRNIINANTSCNETALKTNLRRPRNFRQQRYLQNKHFAKQRRTNAAATKGQTSTAVNEM